MSRWVVTIRIWPYSTEAGCSKGGCRKDKEAVGGKEEIVVEVPADTIDRAVELGKLVVLGVKTNPRVWQSDVVGATLKKGS